MVCPVCGYRYGFWRFVGITNPWRIRCRGCDNGLLVKDCVLWLVSLAAAVAAVASFLGRVLVVAHLGLHSAGPLRFGIAVGALAVAAGFAGEYAIWRYARLSIQPDRAGRRSE